MAASGRELVRTERHLWRFNESLLAGTRDLSMAILVTGGAGYIGSHTVRLLRKPGRPVVVLDSLESGYAPAVGDVPLVVGDIADDGLVASIVAKDNVDAVLHFAGYKAAGESMRQPGR